MKIFVNDAATVFDGLMVSDLVRQLSLPESGVAVAIGADIVPRPDWATTRLHEADRVLIIKAASGG